MFSCEYACTKWQNNNMRTNKNYCIHKWQRNTVNPITVKVVPFFNTPLCIVVYIFALLLLLMLLRRRRLLLSFVDSYTNSLVCFFFAFRMANARRTHVLEIRWNLPHGRLISITNGGKKLQIQFPYAYSNSMPYAKESSPMKMCPDQQEFSSLSFFFNGNFQQKQWIFPLQHT